MLLTILGIISVLALLLFALYKYYNDGNQDYWKAKGIPCLGKNEILSIWDMLTFKFDFYELDLKIYNTFRNSRFGGYVSFRQPILYVTDLELAKHILVKDFDHFVDRRTINANQHDYIFSKMLPIRTGKEWKSLRSVMSPTFTTGKIKRMFQYFNACGHQFATYLEDMSKSKSEVEFQDAFGRYTVSAIASVVFGLDELDVFTNEDSYFRKMVIKMQSVSPIQMIKFLLVMLIPKFNSIFRFRLSEPESTDFFTAIIKKNIEGRRANRGKEKRQDFLQMMMEVQEGQLEKEEETKDLDQFEKDALLTTSASQKKELDADLDDESIIAQSFLFFSAGFDTVQTALAMAVYELALNPEVQEKLAEEVIPVMENNKGDLTYETTHSMKYLDMFVSESLRKNPPAAMTERQCTIDYKIPETDLVIPKGTIVQVPINGVHQDERYYSNPEKFDPENFTAENKAKRHPCAYRPFGQGPRNCIAMRFAITEVKAALAHLVYKFKVEPCEQTLIPIKRSRTTQKPESMWLKFEPRIHEN